MNKIDALQINTSIVDTFVLESAEIRQTKSTTWRPAKDYLVTTLSAGSSKIQGMCWNWPSAKAAPELNKVYAVAANVGEYNGRKQLTITDISLYPNQDMSEFMPSVGIPREELYEELMRAIADIKDEKLANIVTYIYTNFKDEILNATAAKSIHHVGIGGLVQHTLEVYHIAKRTALVYPNMELNLDLIQAGALLHDIGKIYTYQYGGSVISHTIKGNLFEHILLGIKMISKAIDALGPEYVKAGNLLQHIVTSHHMKLEYGSPVTPKFAEAYIVSFADNISATLGTLQIANDKVGKVSLTDKIYTCGNAPHITQWYVSEMLK